MDCKACESSRVDDSGMLECLIKDSSLMWAVVDFYPAFLSPDELLDSILRVLKSHSKKKERHVSDTMLTLLRNITKKYWEDLMIGGFMSPKFHEIVHEFKNTKLGCYLNELKYCLNLTMRDPMRLNIIPVQSRCSSSSATSSRTPSISPISITPEIECSITRTVTDSVESFEEEESVVVMSMDSTSHLNEDDRKRYRKFVNGLKKFPMQFVTKRKRLSTARRKSRSETELIQWLEDPCDASEKKCPHVIYVSDLEAQFPYLTTKWNHDFHEGFSSLDLTCMSIAQQLTLMSSYLYRNIKPREFLHKGWKKESKWMTSVNVVRMIEHFQDISKWTSYQVIMSVQSTRERIKRFKKLVKVARHCLEYKNFVAANGIRSALDHSALQKLDMKKHLSKKDSAAYQHFLDITLSRNLWDLEDASKPPGIVSVNRFTRNFVRLDDYKYSSIQQYAQNWKAFSRLASGTYPWKQVPEIQCLLMAEFKIVHAMNDEDLYQMID